MMWGGGYGWSGLGSWVAMGFMIFFGLLVLIGAVLLVMWLVRGGQSGAGSMTGHDSGTSSACDIAKQRYARGEIGKDEYYDICRTLGGR